MAEQELTAPTNDVVPAEDAPVFSPPQGDFPVWAAPLEKLETLRIHDFRTVILRAAIRFVEFRDVLKEKQLNFDRDGEVDFAYFLEEIGLSDATLDEIRGRVIGRLGRLTSAYRSALACAGLPANLASDGIESDIEAGHSPSARAWIATLLYGEPGTPTKLLSPVKEISGFALAFELSAFEVALQNATGLIPHVDLQVPAKLEAQYEQMQHRAVGQLLGRLTNMYHESGGTGDVRILHSSSFVRPSATNLYIRLEIDPSGAESAKYGIPDSYDLMKSLAKRVQDELNPDKDPLGFQICAYRLTESSQRPISVDGPQVVELSPEERITFAHFAAEILNDLSKRAREPLSPYVSVTQQLIPNSRKYWEAILSSDDESTFGGFALSEVLGIQRIATGFQIEQLKRYIEHSFPESGTGIIDLICRLARDPGWEKSEKLQVKLDF